MDTKVIGIFFRIFCIITIVCAVSMFFPTPGTPEFVINVVSLVAALVLSVVSGIIFFKKRKEDDE